MIDAVRKFWRYTMIYGPRRSLFKAAGRLRGGRVWWLGIGPRGARDISVIGCGQFAFATIGYVIFTHFGWRFGKVFDPDPQALASFSRFYCAEEARSAAEVIGSPATRLVYIASNHASHADYAVAALEAGHDVYCEKPLAVTEESFDRLMAAREGARGRLFGGYNRPFAPAIRTLGQHCRDAKGPLTLTCVVAGHMLGPDHWYRQPEEGTRICGNVGHWLVLMVHICSWHTLPKEWRIDCIWSNEAVRDDDLTIVLTSAAGDLVTITLTARAEPFEGISEWISLQWGNVTAIVNDFRTMTVNVGALRFQSRYWPKDVGHVAAILQPFTDDVRDFREIEHSTRLMLAIADMLRSGTRSAPFVFSDA